jgi:hypothetical protein
MLTVRDHDMDVSDVGELREDDRVCLEQLGQCLVSTDAWRRFGIWLLHKHFEPEPGEVFVEHTMRAPRKSETTPIERFGVRLIRNPLDLAEHELLHETCDRATRTLHCSVGERDAMLADETIIQTAWQWRVVQGGTDIVVMQDCAAGCVRVGEGHDIGQDCAAGTDDFDNPTEGGPNLPF